jgi:hypothetical protein
MNNLKNINIDNILEEFNYIKTLETDWDWEGAEKINIKNWYILEKILHDIYDNIPEDLNDIFASFKEPFIMPGFNWDIHISWRKESVLIGLGIFKNWKIVFNLRSNGKNYWGDFSLEKFYLDLRILK